MARTKNFADVIRSKLAADPSLAEAVEEESFNADLAMKVYEARKEAGLTQRQLAALVGTQQSVIARMEDADYDGRSLNLLRRIGRALGKSVLVEFYACPAPATVEITETFSPDWSLIGGWQPEIQPDMRQEHSESNEYTLPSWPSGSSIFD